MSFLGGYDQNDSERVPDRRSAGAAGVRRRRRRPRPSTPASSYNRANQTRVLGLTVNGGTSFYGGDDPERRADQEPQRRPDLVEARSAARRGSRSRSASSTTRSIPSPRSSPSRGDIADRRAARVGDAGRRGARLVGVGRRPLASSTGWAVATRSTAASATPAALQRRPELGQHQLHGRHLEFSRQLQRTTALTVAYGYSSGEYAPLIDGGGTRPLVGHVIQGGMNFSKRLSPRRAAQFSFTVGATRTEAVTGGDAARLHVLGPLGFGVGPRRSRPDLGALEQLQPRHDGAVGPDARGLQLRCVQHLARRFGRDGSCWCSPAAWLAASTGVGALESSDYTSYTGAAQASVPIGGHAERPRRIQLVQLRGERHHVAAIVVAAGLPAARHPRGPHAGPADHPESLSDRRRDTNAAWTQVHARFDSRHPLQGTLDRRRHRVRRHLRRPVRGAHDGRHLHRRSDGAGAAAARPRRLRAADGDLDRRGAAEDHRRGDPQPDAARAGDHRVQPLPREPRRRRWTTPSPRPTPR